MTKNGILRKKILGIFGLKFRGGLTFGANLTLLHYHYKHFPRVKFTIIPFRCIFIEFDLVKMIFFGHVSFFWVIFELKLVIFAKSKPILR